MGKNTSKEREYQGTYFTILSESGLSEEVSFKLRPEEGKGTGMQRYEGCFLHEK